MSLLYLFALLFLVVLYALAWHDAPAHEPINKKEKP